MAYDPLTILTIPEGFGRYGKKHGNRIAIEKIPLVSSLGPYTGLEYLEWMVRELYIPTGDKEHVKEVIRAYRDGFSGVNLLCGECKKEKAEKVCLPFQWVEPTQYEGYCGMKMDTSIPTNPFYCNSCKPEENILELPLNLDAIKKRRGVYLNRCDLLRKLKQVGWLFLENEGDVNFDPNTKTSFSNREAKRLVNKLLGYGEFGDFGERDIVIGEQPLLF